MLRDHNRVGTPMDYRHCCDSIFAECAGTHAARQTYAYFNGSGVCKRAPSRNAFAVRWQLLWFRPDGMATKKRRWYAIHKGRDTADAFGVFQRSAGMQYMRKRRLPPAR